MHTNIVRTLPRAVLQMSRVGYAPPPSERDAPITAAPPPRRCCRHRTLPLTRRAPPPRAHAARSVAGRAPTRPPRARPAGRAAPRAARGARRHRRQRRRPPWQRGGRQLELQQRRHRQRAPGGSCSSCSPLSTSSSHWKHALTPCSRSKLSQHTRCARQVLSVLRRQLLQPQAHLLGVLMPVEQLLETVPKARLLQLFSKKSGTEVMQSQ